MSSPTPQQGPCILVVDDDHKQRRMLAGFLERNGFVTREADGGEDALAILDDKSISMVISDVRMPGMSGLDLFEKTRNLRPALPFLIITAFADLREAVTVIREGAANYLEKPIVLDELLDTVRHALGETPGAGMDAEEALPALPKDFLVHSPAMRDLVREVALVAPSEARVLITGANGTGKEVVANLIHAWSERSTGPFLKINCGAIPENILESELFGHEKGAFTGAVTKRKGLFAEADGGTLLLDEVGEMPRALQVKLLRVTEQGRFIPVGSAVEQSCDVRILAATNRDLEAEVEAGRFREDLFFRLNTFEIHVPPLKHRREDILPLARRFAAAYGDGRESLSPAVLSLLNAYDWPGNVRELRNAMERAVLMAKGGGVILPEHLPKRIRRLAEPTSAGARQGGNPIEDIERLTILQTLKNKGFNRTETARELGMPRRTLTYKLRRLREAGYEVDRDR